MRTIGRDVVFRRVVAFNTGELSRWRGLVPLGNFTGVVWVRRALTEPTCGSLPQLLGENMVGPFWECFPEQLSKSKRLT